MNDIKLKPCPFCGGDAYIDDHFFRTDCVCTYGVACRGCGAQITQFYPTPQDAADAWNMRVENG